MKLKYDFQKIERKWQKKWAQDNYRLWRAKDFSKKKKFYLLDMFPYPSGEGLHVGHVEGYTATDIYSRWLRLNGYNVLHPMGWDSFGLPAENYAIKMKIHPEISVKNNIRRFKKQCQMVGFSYDWTREFATSDPYYYKWTQWIFLQLFHHGLAYKDFAFINWCRSCKTGLAEEDLENGVCERCKSPVERRLLSQWMLKITWYAERLLKDLDELNWPENVKEMQRNWIGKSVGYTVKFPVFNPETGGQFSVEVFTTRLDTIFGATYLVLAPEHPLVREIVASGQKKQVEQYISLAINKSELNRTAAKEKTGVFTGAYAVNPANNKRIPIWISEYVLPNYGTGAIMGVPAHDQRDFEFAKKFGLEIIEVVSPDGKQHSSIEFAYEGDGVLVSSGPFNRLNSRKAQEKIANFVGAKKDIFYKMKDWVFARQRYWGEPFPLVFCQECKKRVEDFKGQIPHNKQFAIRGLALQRKYRVGNLSFSLGELLNPGWIGVLPEDLPVTLPKVKYYEPTGTGQSPLANISDWVQTKCPKCGSIAQRETDTMPSWAGSSWYYLGFALGKKNLKMKDFKKGWDRKVLDYWLKSPGRRNGGGVDFYVGGVEHATRHLIYARFWHKFLYDLGLVPSKEPFLRLVNQGLILGPDGEKMSKSRGNTINPDDVIKQYGADSIRLYEMFLGPLELSKSWDTKSIAGVFRFLNRVFQLVAGNFKARKKPFAVKTNRSAFNELRKAMHRAIKKVTEDISDLRFNTAISALMEIEGKLADNVAKISESNFRNFAKDFLILLFPFAPHLASELWQYVGSGQIDAQKWPKYNAKLIIEETVTYAVQVNGKLRATISVLRSLSQDEVISQSRQLEKVKQWISGKKIKQIVFVKEKIVNFVV